jgi:sulfate transport system substrate-binding protein
VGTEPVRVPFFISPIPELTMSVRRLWIAGCLLISGQVTAFAEQTILNVSYEPTRRLYSAINRAFVVRWYSEHGERVSIYQSHGGSGKQARSVAFGLEADVVTLALAYDIDAINQRTQLLASDWQRRFPNNSSPYTSTIVFLVRKGNPKNVKDWDDLVRSDIAIVTPNPKTSGGARWNHMAAWAHALKRNNNDEIKGKEFMARLYQNVPILDTGARAATISFTRRGIGDVLIAWENEALLAARDIEPGNFEIIVPSLSILAESPVAIVDSVVDKRGSRQIAEAYINFLYAPEGQELAAEHYFRPRSHEVAERYNDRFPRMNLVTIDQLGGWAQAQKAHFADGGLFDQVFRSGT